MTNDNGTKYCKYFDYYQRTWTKKQGKFISEILRNALSLFFKQFNKMF